MQLIHNWLCGKQNFLVGRILYAQYGKEEHLKLHFAKGEKEPGAKEALLAALQGLVAVPTVPEKKEFVVMPGNADPVLQSMHVDWKTKYQQMQYLRVQLDTYGNDNSLETRAACHLICKDILYLEKDLIESWKRYDYYLLHGKLPDAKEPVFEIPKQPVQLATKISSLQRYIRRHKLNAEKHPDNPKYPALVHQYQQQLNLLLNAKD